VRDTHILICEKKKRVLGLEIAIEVRTLGKEEATEARGSSRQRRRPRKGVNPSKVSRSI